MEKNQSNLSTLEKLTEIAVEQSVDDEIVLPDYYPEITRILKCLTEVSFFNKQLNAKKIDITGQVAITLLYSDKDDNINSFSRNIPFSKSIDCDLDLDDCFVSVDQRGEFLNTKATAPRKVEIHGSLNLGVVVTAYKTVSIPCECIENVFAKPCNISFTEQYLPITKSLFLEDEISVGPNKQPISKILRSSATVKINECKIVSNKVVLKGEMNVQVLYCPTQSIRPILLEHTHAFSHIIDNDNISEGSNCSAAGNVVSFELHPKTSLDGEVKSVTFEAKVNIDIQIEKDIECSCLTDAFSNRYRSNVDYISVDLIKKLNDIQENFVCKKSLEFSEGSLSEIYDVWCKNAVGFVSYDEGEILIKGTVFVYILGCNFDGEPSYFERSVDYEYRYGLEETDKKHICKSNVIIAAVNYSKNSENGVDIAVELVICSKVYTSDKISVVSCVSLDEESPISLDNETAITLYFAEGEKVWEIAKSYKADPEKICKVNNLENIDCICNKILLIPNM